MGGACASFLRFLAPLLLLPGMELAVRLFQVRDGQPQITLRRRQRLVAEHFLNVPQVGVIFQQVRGATVPPQMTGDVFFEPQLARILGQQPVNAMLADGQAVPDGDEQFFGWPAFRQFRPDGFEIIFEILAGDAAQGHDAVFAALALVDAQQFLLQVHVRHVQVAQLLLADAGGVKHFEQRPVAVADQRLRVRRFNDAAGLLRRQDVFGQRVRLAGQPQAFGRIAGEITFLRQELEKIADGDDDVVLRADAARRALPGRLVKNPALKVLQRRGRDGLHVGQLDLGQKLGEAVEVKLVHAQRVRRVVEHFQLLPVAVEQHVEGQGFG